MYILLFQKWRNKIPVGKTWGHRPQNFLAVGAIAMINCLSVRPSVRLVDCDHMRWNSSKIISRIMVLYDLSYGLGSRASADPSITDLLQTDHLQILARIEVG